jgi:hypothetical protein
LGACRWGSLRHGADLANRFKHPAVPSTAPAEEACERHGSGELGRVTNDISHRFKAADAHPSHVNPTGDGADEEPAPQPPCETEAPGNPLGVSPAEPAVGYPAQEAAVADAHPPPPKSAFSALMGGRGARGMRLLVAATAAETG